MNERDAEGRRLFLLRHATTGPAREMGDDADLARVLTSSGEAEASRIAAHLSRMTDLSTLEILASPARRTCQTAERVADVLAADGPRPAIMTDPVLYNADCETILDVIRETGADASLMVVGHNPGLYHLVLKLAGDAIDAPEFASLTQGYPPASLAIFDITGDWGDLRPGRADLTGLLRP
jgi:phosphohistidine phosphatase